MPVAKLARKSPCSEYDASNGWFPALGWDIGKVADPLISGFKIGGLLSMLNDTLPVGVIPGTDKTSTLTLPSEPYVIPYAVIVVCVAAFVVVNVPA